MDPQAEWTIFDERWWLLPLALRVVAVCGVLVICTLSGLQVDRFAMVLAILVVLNTSLSWWARVRLTPDGVEVRRIRTRLYRWEDLEAVTATAGWQGKIMLRGRKTPTGGWSAIPFPRAAFRTADDPTMSDAAAEIASRIEHARTDPH